MKSNVTFTEIGPTFQLTKQYLLHGAESFFRS